MLFDVSHRILSETASADLLDPAVDSEVKNVVDDLQDALTTNVEEVPAEDKETNNAVLTAEACTIFEAAIAGRKYAVDIRDIMRICEAEEEETGVTPDAGDVAQDVAQANDADSEDLVVVAPADVAQEMIESALNEAKAGKKCGKAKKKAGKLAKALNQIKKKGVKVALVGKK